MPNTPQTVLFGKRILKTLDPTEQKLFHILDRLTTADGEHFIPLYTELSSWLQDLPTAETPRLMSWLASLWQAVKEKRLPGTEIEVFVEGALNRQLPEAFPLLGEMLLSPAFYMKETIAERAGEIGPAMKPLVPALIQFIGQPDNPGDQADWTWAKAKACWALGKIGDRTAIPALTKAAAEQSPPIKDHAIEALAALA